MPLLALFSQLLGVEQLALCGLVELFKRHFLENMLLDVSGIDAEENGV